MDPFLTDRLPWQPPSDSRKTWGKLQGSRAGGSVKPNLDRLPNASSDIQPLPSRFPTEFLAAAAARNGALAASVAFGREGPKPSRGLRPSCGPPMEGWGLMRSGPMPKQSKSNGTAGKKPPAPSVKVRQARTPSEQDQTASRLNPSGRRRSIGSDRGSAVPRHDRAILL